MSPGLHLSFLKYDSLKQDVGLSAHQDVHLAMTSWCPASEGDERPAQLLRSFLWQLAMPKDAVLESEVSSGMCLLRVQA